MIATNVRRLGVYLVLSFAALSVGLSWWQVVDARALASRPDNPELIAARRSLPRGTIFDATGQVLASTQVVDGLASRSYTDTAFSHVIGYASLRFETTGVERAFDDVLSGQSDPNPIREVVEDIFAQDPVPKDVTLTIDQRLQDFAAAQLGSDPGAVVALDPATGAILALVSVPTYDPTPISGDPATAQAPMDALRADPALPLLPRATQGTYVPGSIMKVFTASAALDADAITPETTFPDQPQQETDGFLVEGFTITEHDLAGIRPELWALSPAFQVSSNIYFAHTSLELGPELFLDYARRFGFCAPLEIGPSGRALPVIPSYVSGAVEGDCSPFDDSVELAVAGFGQAEVIATPTQMALVAATIANDGVMPSPYVVRDVRSHVTEGSPSETVLETYRGGGSRRIISVETARQVRSIMVDAVNAELGALYAGQGNIQLYGIADSVSAGKTGTAQLGGEAAPHSWFIGFAPAQEGATPSIAVAVMVESGGSGSGRAAPIGGALLAEWLRLSGAAQ